MSITGAQLIAAVAVTGADTAATQLLGVGTSADAAQTSLLSTSSAAASAAPALAGLAAVADSDTVSLSGLADAVTGTGIVWDEAAIQAASYTDILAGLAAGELQLADTSAAVYSSQDAVAASFTATSAAADKASAAALRNATSFDVMGAASTAASGALDVLGKVGSFAFDALKTGAEAVTIVGVAATFLAGKFQVEMTKLQTTAGELHSNLKMVGSGILDMAGQVGIGALKLGDAMYWIESGGAHGAAALTDLKIAAEGAKAEGSNLDDVAKALMGTLNAFKGTGLTAAEAMNVLINSTANGMMTLQDLSNAMSNVSPVAAKFGISVIDIGAGLATMTAQGDGAEQAATHLRQIILALEAPAAAGAKALKSIGLTTQEVSDAMRKSLPDAIEMITTDLGKKFPEGSAAYNEALKNIAGGNKQLLALLETSGASMKTYKDNVAKISDAVKQGGKDVAGWAEVQANFNTMLDQAGAAIESVFIKIGTALLPVLSQLFQQVTPTITAFSQWIDKSGVLSGVTQTLSGWVGKLGEAFNYVKDAFNQVFNPIQSVSTVMKPLLDSFDRATAVIKPVGEALKQLGQVAAPARDIFDRLHATVKKTNDTIAQSPNLWVPFWEFVKRLIEDVKRIDWGSIGNGLNNIRIAISKMDWGKVGAFFSGIAQSIEKVDWGKVGKDIEQIAIGFTKVDWGKVGTALSGIVNSLLKVDWGKIGSDIKALLDNLSTVDWKGVLQGFTDVINGIKTVVQWFQWMERILVGASIIPDLINAIVRWFSSLPGRLVGIITGTVNSIVSWFASLPGRLAGIIIGTVNSIVNWFAQLPGRLGALIIGLVNSIAGWWGTLPGRIAAFGGSIIGALTSPFQTAVNVIGGILGGIGGQVNNALGQIGNLINTASQVHIPGFASGIENFGGGLAYVHAGEVLTYLPPGTSVTPASRVSSGSSASGQPVQININIAGHRVAQALLPDITSEIRRATGVRF